MVPPTPVPEQQRGISGSRHNVAVTPDVRLWACQTCDHVPVTEHDLSELACKQTYSIYLLSLIIKWILWFKVCKWWQNLTLWVNNSLNVQWVRRTCVWRVNTETLVPEAAHQDVAVISRHHKTLCVDLNALVNQVSDLSFVCAWVVSWQRHVYRDVLLQSVLLKVLNK